MTRYAELQAATNFSFLRGASHPWELVETAGVLGMEHGNSKPGKEGERALIDAYRACDAF